MSAAKKWAQAGTDAQGGMQHKRRAPPAFPIEKPATMSAHLEGGCCSASDQTPRGSQHGLMRPAGVAACAMLSSLHRLRRAATPRQRRLAGGWKRHSAVLEEDEGVQHLQPFSACSLASA